MRLPFFAATIVLLIGMRSASAQLPGATSLPTVLHLKNVPVGSSATYRVLMQGQPSMRQKIALVQRTETSASMEIAVGPDPARAEALVLVRMDLTFQSNGQYLPGAMVIQVGANRPMVLPAQLTATQGALFELIGAGALGAPETIKVAAGRFKVRRYQPKGAKKIAWMSADVPPFGLVKLSEAREGTAVEMELLERGAGSKPALTATPVPFDANKLMQQMQASQGGGGK